MMSIEAMTHKLRMKIGPIPWNDLEDLILGNSYVWRPIRGHIFETWFVRQLESHGYEARRIGGDTGADLKCRRHTLQLKTPTASQTRQGLRIAYSTHRTHGREKGPERYTHEDLFADFLVGQYPNSTDVMICPKSEVPRYKQDNRRLASPVTFAWDNPWKNRFDLIGLNITKLSPLLLNPSSSKMFPKIGKLANLSDKDILLTITAEENFRVLDQNLCGIVREYYFKERAMKEGIKLLPVTSTTRGEVKIDFRLPDGRRIQVKGRTKGLSGPNHVGVEVKGSHGRIPQRLYRVDAFDLLVVALDQRVVPACYRSATVDPDGYNFVVIPVENLPLHPRSAEWGQKRLKGEYTFRFDTYVINDFSLLRTSKRRTPNLLDYMEAA